MRSFKFISLCLVALWTLTLRADTFQLNDGRTITGELLLTSANDAGVKIKTGDNNYENFSWSEFSQVALKELAQKPKLGQYVEPFIEIPQETRIKKTEVKLNEVPHLNLPPKGSLIGGLFGSSVGLLCLLLIYAANIYAGYEIATVRAYPPAMVCGIAAVAPVVGPIIFLCLPTRMQGTHDASAAATAPAAEAAVSNPFAGDPAAAEHATGLHFAEAAQAPAAAAQPATEVFQRGQYTFNRRFIETKFAAFFAMIRREADKDLVLVLKTARGEFTATRITRIASNDMHVDVRKGAATAEVAIPFAEIQEIQIRHKDT